MNKTKLSIVILSWNTKEFLGDCLESVIRDQLSGISYQGSVVGKNKKPITNHRSPITDHQSPVTEIIVVDNGSTDGSVEYLRELIDNSLITGNRSPITLRLIENKENLGFSKGNNIGIKEAQGEYIMLLNSDTIVKEKSIEKLLNHLEKNPETAVSPLLVLPDGNPQLDYYMRFPNLWQIFLYHNPLIRPFAMHTPLKTLFCQQPKEEPFEVDQLPGAALVASRKTWEKVGSLDPDFKFLWEDVDWSWRAKKKGIKLMVVPEAEIIHFGGASWKKKIKTDKQKFYKQFFASMLLFVKKHYPEREFAVFKHAIAANFLSTLKFSLFFELMNGNFGQEELWK